MRLKPGWVLAMVLLSAAQACAGELEDHILSGAKFVQDKKYKEAAREFEVAVNLAPDDPQANLLLAQTLANIGELDRSVQYALKSVQTKPNYAGYYILGLVYANQGKYDQAAEAYAQATQQNPKSYQAWYFLGKVHFTALRFEEAADAYRKAIELNPKFPDAYQGLGAALYWTGNLTGALEEVDQLSKLGFGTDAKALENWIKDKESKKKAAAKKAGAAEPAKKVS